MNQDSTDLHEMDIESLIAIILAQHAAHIQAQEGGWREAVTAAAMAGKHWLKSAIC
jgi:hypothetical protein